MPPPFAVETAPTSPVPCPFVGAVLTAIFYSSAAPLRGRDRSHGSGPVLVGAVLTAIFYSNAAPFAVETAPTGSAPCPFVGAVLTAIFYSNAAPSLHSDVASSGRAAQTVHKRAGERPNRITAPNSLYTKNLTAMPAASTLR